MAMTIGRATGLRPRVLNRSGDSVSIDGSAIASSPAELAARFQQLRGLIDNPDETVVPVTWDANPIIDGFYRVTGVQVAPIGPEGKSSNGRISVAMERVGGGYALPPQEIAVAEAARAGAFSVSRQKRLWVPTDAVWQGVGGSIGTRATETGSVTGYDLDGVDTVLPGQFTIAPADHHDGACVVEAEVSSGVWLPVVGDQVPAGMPLRIGNGFVRFTPGTGPAQLHVWDGSAWDLVGSFAWSIILPTSPFSNFAGSALGAVGVLRNSPEAAAIKIDVGDAGRLTVGLARGDAAFTINITGPTLSRPGITWKINASTTTAATSIAGAGIRQTSNGATGHRWIMDAAKSSTTNLTDGGISLTSSDSPHMLGVELNGSSSSGVNTAANVRAQWWSAISQRQQVVSR